MSETSGNGRVTALEAEWRREIRESIRSLATKQDVSLERTASVSEQVHALSERVDVANAKNERTHSELHRRIDAMQQGSSPGLMERAVTGSDWKSTAAVLGVVASVALAVVGLAAALIKAVK